MQRDFHPRQHALSHKAALRLIHSMPTPIKRVSPLFRFWHGLLDFMWTMRLEIFAIGVFLVVAVATGEQPAPLPPFVAAQAELAR